MNEQQKISQEESDDGRESSLSADSAHEHHSAHQRARVLGEPLSDRSSSQSESVGGAERQPRALIDAESRQVIDDEFQAEEDSLQFFEEQERKIALQLAQENSETDEQRDNEGEATAAQEEEGTQMDEDGADGAASWRDLMSRIEEEEDDQIGEYWEEEEEEQRQAGEKKEFVENGEKRSGKGERKEAEWERDGEEEEEEMEKVEENGEKEEEDNENGSHRGGGRNGRLSAENGWISNDEEAPPRSGYSHISESLQNREFSGADLLTHTNELDEQQKTKSSHQFTEGYSLGYPSEPPPAYSSPRKGTTSEKILESDTNRYPVPAPYEMALFGHHDEHTSDTEENSVAEGSSTANIRSAIGNSITLAGGMAAAVFGAPPADNNHLLSSGSNVSPQFTSPRAASSIGVGGHGVDSPRRAESGGGQRQNASPRVVHGARTVAELHHHHHQQQQQRANIGREGPTTNEDDTAQDKMERRPSQTAATAGGAGGSREVSATGVPQHTLPPPPPPSIPISADLKALFGQIEEYVAERVEIVPNWKPFQIDYIPAVGDVDPFIKVPRPDDNDELLLGLAVLDEPAMQQSDSAIVDLRLHQMAGNSSAADAPVKKLSRADKNAHQIDRWIQNVKELRRTRAPTRVVYGKPMPSIEALMQEWPVEIEQKLKEMKLLINANLDAELEDFVDLCLALVDIPVHKSRLESLHVLFTLYAEFRASQHFRNMALMDHGDDPTTHGRAPSTTNNIDQFVVPE